ncbi:MAG: 30S ribosomal protein S1 [Alphaproteobacteria bacterium]|nr:30S ribosomal protein S1 [Alphaproteobacteria bacterium]
MAKEKIMEEMPPMNEDFASLLDEMFDAKKSFEGSVVKGKIVAIDDDYALIDVGLKSEGRIALRECGSNPLNVGDEIDVFIDRYEDKDGMVVLSREKARREEAWNELEIALNKGERVNGVIFGRVKGGFTVDLNGAVAFLPGSQVDIRPIRDISPLLGVPQPFQLLKMDKARGNIVVSRRAVLEETRAEQRSELIKNLSEGQILDGVVKNITDYGAFIDLGGVDGLLHVTDISWKRINHPSEVLTIGQTIKVQIIRFNPDTQRISLGVKQLDNDPWAGVEERFPVGTKFNGHVTNITDYGAFVELDEGVEGLVHVSEMSWTKKNVHPGKIVSTSQEVEVMVLDVDQAKRRISLGLKQCMENPWKKFAESFPVGTVIEGEIRNITEFGLFVGLAGEIDGMVHLSDLDWNKSGEDAVKDYKKGDMVKAKVLDIDVEKERVSLGIKQLAEDPFAGASSELKKGDVVTCVVTAVSENGIDVDVNGMRGFIRKADLSRERTEQRPDRFAVGDKVDAKITQIDAKSRKLTLSVKAKEIAEEKQALSEYGSADSGASLGDILGAALAKKAGKAKKGEAEEEAEKPAKEPKAKKAKAEKAQEAEEAVEAEVAIEPTAEEEAKAE